MNGKKQQQVGLDDNQVDTKQKKKISGGYSLPSMLFMCKSRWRWVLVRQMTKTNKVTKITVDQVHYAPAQQSRMVRYGD